MGKLIITKAFIFSTLIFIIGCTTYPHSRKNSIRIKGSDTMLILVQRWAEYYMKNNPGISIYVEGGGTATGFSALIEGKADICSASRPLLSEEAKPMAEKFGNLGIAHLVAKDALSIYLNPNNPVKNLSVQALKDIFIGKIKNWKNVGGLNEKIIVIIRPPNSGTHLYFKDHILGGNSYTEDATVLPNTTMIVNTIIENPNAIGYGGIGYGSNLWHCSIDGVRPSEKNVRNDLYPITRYLNLYTIKKPVGEVKKFIDWVISPKGQRIVKEVGYISLWEN